MLLHWVLFIIADEGRVRDSKRLSILRIRKQGARRGNLTMIPTIADCLYLTRGAHEFRLQRTILAAGMMQTSTALHPRSCYSPFAVPKS